MLRQLLMVLVLVFGVILFAAGCEQDGTNGVGTTDGDGIYEEDTTQEDTMQDGTADDEYNLERGLDQDTTDTTQQDDMQDGMQDDMQDDMQDGTAAPEDTTNGTNGTDPNAANW